MGIEASSAWCKSALLAMTAAVVGFGSPVAADEPRWFPVQAVPGAVVQARVDQGTPEQQLATAFMVQSIAGLAAKAVNRGQASEMVWVATGSADQERWYTLLRQRHPAIKDRGKFTAWELVDWFQKAGVIKGYILYRRDGSTGELNEHRPGMDCSVNVATSLAGVLDGIVVEEGLEAAAKARGLTMLCDVRNKSQAWCFQTHKASFNRRLICMQDPRKPHVRDLAIAQGALTIYGDDELAREAFEWLEPLSPVLGWNGGDEFVTTRMSTEYGHLQTATDWCMNLPVLMAGSEQTDTPPVKSFDPRTIDWSDQRSGVSFILSDGDNVQWLTGNFFGNASYWDSPQRGHLPFGWSGCFAHLAQLCPAALDHAVATQTPRDHFLEWGGGYYYSDLFASKRQDRWELLAQHAQRTWQLMQQNGTTIVGFNVAEPTSEAARKAYQVFAGETEGLLGILVFQYAPYEGGAGRIDWVKDRAGIEIPVVTARYSIWEHTNQRPRSGAPAKVAREIRGTVQNTPEGAPRYDWAIAHAWSYFRRSPGADEDAENMAQVDAAERGGERGYAPVVWCVDRLPAEIRVICPEELFWRIRRINNPVQTRELIEMGYR